jgi:3-oxoacyl-[acyl-carrier-protein] synthase-3
MGAEDIDLFVPHQANLRIIESAAKRLHLSDDKVFVNVHKYGNTSGGSIPLGLYEAEREGRLKKGMIVMTVGFGAGLVWGANLIRW